VIIRKVREKKEKIKKGEKRKKKKRSVAKWCIARQSLADTAWNARLQYEKSEFVFLKN